MDELTKLAVKYGTDKWGKHNYTPVYYEMFKSVKDDIKKVLEIGIAEGAGLRMFRDFFPNATIYGADIDEKRVSLIEDEDRIVSYCFDQSNIKNIYDLFTFLSDVDIVIDDGSHEPIDQILTCYGAMPLLKESAIYIIEDVADAKVAEFLSKKYDVKVVECGKRYDDRLVIVRHKNG